MQIRQIEAIPIEVPLSKPMMLAGRRHDTSQSLLVRVICANGREGWGEAAPLAKVETLSNLVGEVRELASAIAGRSLEDRARILAETAASRKYSPRSLAALDMAMADAFARSCNLRVCDLYGGAVRDFVLQKWIVSGSSFEDEIAEVEALRKKGLSFFMLKVATKPIDHDIELTRRLRQRFGGEIELCADANGGWKADTVRSYLDGIAGADLTYLEQPLPSEDLAGSAAIVASYGTPVSLDEGVASSADILAAYAMRAASGAVIKPSKYGGIGRAVEAGLLCNALKLKVGLATAIAETSLATSAALQVAAVIPEVAWAISPSADYLVADIVEQPIRHVDGRLMIPTGPGLGAEVDRKRVEQFRLDRRN